MNGTANGPARLPLPYQDDSSTYMTRLAGLANPVFIDSGGQGGESGRYDILTALPVATVTVCGGALTSSAWLPPEAGRNIWTVAQYLLDRYCGAAVQSARPAPFQGGLCGCLGYPHLSASRDRHIVEAFVGLYPWALVVDHQAGDAIAYFQPWCPQSTRDTVTRRLLGGEDFSFYFNLGSDFVNELSEEEYGQAFTRIKHFIDAGDCYQVNLTQRFASRFTGHPFAAYLRLRRASGKPFSAYLQWDNKSLLSLSPERFLRVTDGQVTTQPIKGTRPRGDSPAEDTRLAEELQASEKDRAENLMIVDLLRNDLGTLCEYGSIRATRLFELQSFDNVHHLVSTVTGRLRSGASALNLLENCFPGGSITGAPKLRAMEIIETLETHPRDFYCGTVFYLDGAGNMDSNITIRSLLCTGDRIYCWAGGGIVADSNCTQEYRECFDKIDRLIKTLQG